MLVAQFFSTLAGIWSGPDAFRLVGIMGWVKKKEEGIKKGSNEGIKDISVKIIFLKRESIYQNQEELLWLSG